MNAGKGKSDSAPGNPKSRWVSRLVTGSGSLASSHTRFLRFVEAFSVLLFVLEALRVIVSATFGIAFDEVNEGRFSAWLFVSSALLLAGLLVPALLAPAVAGGQSERRLLIILVAVAATARVALSINDVDVRFWGSVIVLGAGAAYITLLARTDRHAVLTGLVAALAADQLFRVVGDTYDVSLRPSWVPIQVIWGVVISIIAVQLSRRTAKSRYIQFQRKKK